MRTEKEIREQVRRLIKSNKHVLDCPLATVDINAPRTLMQLDATAKLDVLYWWLQEKRPQFKCDEAI